MKPRIYLSLILSLFLVSTARSQTVYYFQYKFPMLKDSTVYEAFFVRYSDGFGFMRVRFDEPVSGNLILAEMQLFQSEIQLEAGGKDSTKILVDTTKLRFDTTGNIKFYFGSNKTRLSVPGFLFSLNMTTNLFEPAEITVKDSHGIVQKATILNSQVFTADNLNNEVVLHFFTAEEDFSKNMNEPGSRGLTNLSPEQKNMTMHLLIVSNTKDPSIGKACILDTSRAIMMFDSIRRFLQIRLVKKVIAGKNYNKENVVKAIKDLNPKPNDIVVFYYSGHGFRKPEDPRAPPYIDLRPKNDTTYNVNSLNIQDVFNTIRSKPRSARLNLVIADCCNTLPGTEKSNGKSIGGFREINEWSEANCRKLFLDTNVVSVLMTAAEVGQTAACDSLAGSLFSIFFKSVLDNSLSKGKQNVSWYQVVADTKNRVSTKSAHTYCKRPFIMDNVCKQDPIWKVLGGRGN